MSYVDWPRPTVIHSRNWGAFPPKPTAIHFISENIFRYLFIVCFACLTPHSPPNVGDRGWWAWLSPSESWGARRSLGQNHAVNWVGPLKLMVLPLAFQLISQVASGDGEGRFLWGFFLPKLRVPSWRYQSLIFDLCFFPFQHLLYIIQGLECKLTILQLPNDPILAFVSS